MFRDNVLLGDTLDKLIFSLSKFKAIEEKLEYNFPIIAAYY
jgi:hypothetical protein